MDVNNNSYQMNQILIHINSFWKIITNLEYTSLYLLFVLLDVAFLRRMRCEFGRVQ
jgi:hypothetical protein